MALFTSWQTKIFFRPCSAREGESDGLSVLKLASEAGRPEPESEAERPEPESETASKLAMAKSTKTARSPTARPRSKTTATTNKTATLKKMATLGPQVAKEHTAMKPQVASPNLR